MDRTIIATLLLTFFAAGALADERCVTADHGWYNEYEYCTYGCCGYYPNQECCAPFAWVIIVGVIGSIMFLSCIIGVICCVVKQQGHRGQVVAMNRGTVVTTVAQSNATTGAFNYGYQQPSTAYPPNQGHFQQPYQQPNSFPNQQPVPFPNDSKQGIAYPPPYSTQP